MNCKTNGLIQSFAPAIVKMCSNSKGQYDENSIARCAKRQEVANMAWSCAVLEEYPKDLMPLLYTALFGKNCDGDPSTECSYGLHVGATKYVETFGSGDKSVLVCLVNPMNVVAVPNYDNSKIRVREYFPFALGTFEDGKIDIIEDKYFEYDYKSHEESELKALLESRGIKDARSFAMSTVEDTRNDEEYYEILESRVIDLTKMIANVTF